MRIKSACCYASNIILLCPLCLCVSLSTILRARDYSFENTRVCLSYNNSGSTWYRAHLHVHTYRREKFPQCNFRNLRSLFTLCAFRCTLCLCFWCTVVQDYFALPFTGLIFYTVSGNVNIYSKIIQYLWVFRNETINGLTDDLIG